MLLTWGGSVATEEEEESNSFNGTFRAGPMYRISAAGRCLRLPSSFASLKKLFQTTNTTVFGIHTLISDVCT